MELNSISTHEPQEEVKTMLSVARKFTETDSDTEQLQAARNNVVCISTGSSEPPAAASFLETVLNMWTVTFMASHR